jgi:hypothetical protein
MTRLMVVTLAAGLALMTSCWRMGPIGFEAGDGTDADTDGDTDTDGDADGDVDSWTAPDEEFCLPDEVRQPGTDLCWKRCPLAQAWNGGLCAGAKLAMNWCGASGDDAELCAASDPGVSRCEQVLGPGFRLPTRQEFVDLFGGCQDTVIQGSPGYCDSCVDSASCSGMFEGDIDLYWSSSPYGDKRAWSAVFYDGHLDYEVVYLEHEVRCLREGP